MKFEIGRRLFENFRKLEDGVSKFSNIPIFGRNQMNEPRTLEDSCQWNSKVSGMNVYQFGQHLDI